jgi:hypothetical protein
MVLGSTDFFVLGILQSPIQKAPKSPPNHHHHSILHKNFKIPTKQVSLSGKMDRLIITITKRHIIISTKLCTLDKMFLENYANRIG